MKLNKNYKRKSDFNVRTHMSIGDFLSSYEGDFNVRTHMSIGDFLSSYEGKIGLSKDIFDELVYIHISMGKGDSYV